MDLKQLRYFVAIVEYGSLSGAARGLHIAQPALSHHLKNLEAAFGKQLLRREARGIQATRDGEVLYRHAVGILRQTDRLEAILRGSGDQVEGGVAIGLPKTVSPLVSMPLFELARGRYPAIALEVLDGHSRELSRAVLEGRLDIALIMPPAPQQGSIEQALLTEELVVVCPQRAAWLPPGSTLTAAQLAELPLLISNRRERLHMLLEALALQSSGYLAETFRGAIEAIPKGHLEAAGSLGVPRASDIHTDRVRGAASAKIEVGLASPIHLRAELAKPQPPTRISVYVRTDCANFILPCRCSPAA